MSSLNNTTFNSSHSPSKIKASISDIAREIIMGELKLRYVQLMRDFHTSLGKDDANNLIKESVDIWEKLSIQNKN